MRSKSCENTIVQNKKVRSKSCENTIVQNKKVRSKSCEVYLIFGPVIVTEGDEKFEFSKPSLVKPTSRLNEPLQIKYVASQFVRFYPGFPNLNQQISMLTNSGINSSRMLNVIFASRFIIYTVSSFKFMFFAGNILEQLQNFERFQNLIIQSRFHAYCLIWTSKKKMKKRKKKFSQALRFQPCTATSIDYLLRLL